MPRTSIVLLLLLAFATTASAATLPTGFSETLIASGLTSATAMAIAPDGRIFVCLKDGQVRVVKNNTLLPTPFVTITVAPTSNTERGLLGIALDPDFLNNGYVYVYYTATTPTVHNRISRFTAAGDVAVNGSELILVELETLGAPHHNGGAIHFGLDGKLYAATGENGIGGNSQTLGNRLGKMLRYNSDGTIPTDNPFYGTATGDNRSIWAWGLRNPFTFAFHPLSGRMHINDVGQSTWEEVNVGQAGGNYDWPDSEGPTSTPGRIGPLHYYANDSTTCSIAGGTFYAPEVRQFPSTYVESYFFAELCGGWIRRLDQGTSSTSTDFATGISGFPLDLIVGHDGSMYYLTHIGGSLYRVRWNQHLEGDVNNDGTTNAADMFYLANHLYGGGPAPVQGGDVDNNGQINAADLTYLTSYLYGRGATPL